MPVKQKKLLEWSRRSVNDLLEIEAYIARDNQAAADAVVAHIKQRAMALESDPLLGKRRVTTSHRELVLTRFPYLVIYRLRGSAISISRILHQRRQFP